MSKPLYFTGRKEIGRSDITVRLLETSGKPTKFDATFNLDRYELPADGIVVLEAYHNAYLERFAIGTVAQLTLRKPCELIGLEPGDRPLFRAKIIVASGAAKGRLLAAIDEIRPETDDDATANSLLPIVPKSRDQMGDEFWRVHFVSGEEKLPQLWVNRDVKGLYFSLQNRDARVTALIMPEVLRQVLRGLVEDGEEWTEEGRLGQWLELARGLYPDPFEEWDSDDAEGSRQKRREWVDQVVARFATAHQFFDAYHSDPNPTVSEDITDA